MKQIEWGRRKSRRDQRSDNYDGNKLDRDKKFPLLGHIRKAQQAPCDNLYMLKDMAQFVHRQRQTRPSGLVLGELWIDCCDNQTAVWKKQRICKFTSAKGINVELN